MFSCSSNYKDLNSVFYIWFRWSILLNQAFWLFVMIGGMVSSNHDLEIVSYCLGVFPSIIVILMEAVIPCIDYDRHSKGLHHLDFIIWRIIAATFCVILLFVWLINFESCLIVLVWFSVWLLLLIENLNSCRYNDKCCNYMIDNI